MRADERGNDLDRVDPKDLETVHQQLGRPARATVDVPVLGIAQAAMHAAALSAGTGIDYVELGQTLASQAMDGMFAAIAREEAAIRADPRRTRDPLLIDLLAPRR